VFKRSEHFSLDIFSWTFLPGQFLSLLHHVKHSLFHHPPVYNIKRSTVNVHKIDRVINLVSASFQIFALIAGENVLGGEGSFLGGIVWGKYVQGPRGEMSRGMSYSGF